MLFPEVSVGQPARNCLIPVWQVMGHCPLSDIFKVATHMRGAHIRAPHSAVFIPSPIHGSQVTGAHNALTQAINTMVCMGHVVSVIRRRWALSRVLVIPWWTDIPGSRVWLGKKTL